MLPKKGKKFPKPDGKGSTAFSYGREIASALRSELGSLAAILPRAALVLASVSRNSSPRCSTRSATLPSRTMRLEPSTK